MVVLDSSFLCAWYDDRDVHHGAAGDVMRRFLDGEWGRGLLLEYVFLETVTVLLARRGPASAFDSAGRLLEARELDFVPCSDIFLETVDTFRNQPPGHGLSFVDAAIVTVARGLEPSRIATFDRGFSRLEGLEVIPSDEAIREPPAPRGRRGEPVSPRAGSRRRRSGPR